MKLPDAIRTVDELEEMLSEPPPSVVETLRSLPGDILILGVAGKMGPSLARMAKRASDAAGVARRIIGASRFSSPTAAAYLEAHGVSTIPCDLLDDDAIARLPDAPNVLFMAGMKFGATGNESATWAMNSYLPGVVSRRFRRSRIVAFSTGNVYGLVPADGSGSREGDAPNPVGEYAMSCLGRERVFEYFSRSAGVPMATIRLNYACEMRYGVLVDLAQKVWRGDPIPLEMGHFNVLWQGDANAMTLNAFAHATSPPFVINITGPERLSVRSMCERFGELMGKTPQFNGAAGGTALLNDARRAFELFGQPRVQADQMISWIAGWVMRGGPLLGKPTHFESRNGKF
jgi:nucleoside-diphosphate-sugar epimerase